MSGGRLFVATLVALVAGLLIFGSAKGPSSAPRLTDETLPPPAPTATGPEEEAASDDEEAISGDELLVRPGRVGIPKAAAVASVTDGDTIRLRDGTRVRLVQIDAPELAGGECYAAQARRELALLLPPGRRVRLETDPGLDRVDRFGRVLAYVFLGRVNLNTSMVSRGAAAPWFFEGGRGRYAKELLAAARLARAVGQGLWTACPDTKLDPERALETRGGTPAR